MINSKMQTKSVPGKNFSKKEEKGGLFKKPPVEKTFSRPFKPFVIPKPPGKFP